MPKLNYNASVSFEFDTRPPLTHKCPVVAASAASAARTATKIAKAALHPIRWTSFVVVIEKPRVATAEPDRGSESD